MLLPETGSGQAQQAMRLSLETFGGVSPGGRPHKSDKFLVWSLVVSKK